MTAIKNGIKCVLRTPWKTILFSAVLVLLSALLTVSLCVFAAVRRYIKDCDAYFHTIAVLEYVGTDYPDTTVYDEEVETALTAHREEFDSLIRSDAVQFYEPDSNAAAIIEGFHRWDDFITNPNQAVLRLYNQLFDERLAVYMMVVSESYYSQKDYTNKLIMVRPDVMQLPDAERLKSGKAYYAVGQYIQGNTPNPWFLGTPIVFKDGDRTVELPALIQADDNEAIKDDYLRYAEQLRQQNDCCRVQYTGSLEDYPPFQQQMLTLAKGRFFTEQEYADRAHVCILAGRIAGAMDLSVGDSVDLTVFRADGALYTPGTWTEADVGTYEIIGIYSETDDYPFRVFLPDAGAVSDTVSPVTGYRLGTFRLKNDRVDTFLKAAEPLSNNGFRFTVYDQGYAAATEPMRELTFLSIVFFSVSLLLAIAAHALQSHLFVSRQRETAATMEALGSGKRHILLYFLSAVLLLAIVSTAIGCMIGKLLEQRVMDALKRFAMQFANSDLRFSSSRLSLIRTLAFEPKIPLRVYLVSALTLLIGSLIFTAAFAAHDLRAKKAKQKRRALSIGPKKAGKSAKTSGVLKYALLSMRRGVVRTVAVVLLCLITAVFFGRLTASMDGYREQLNAYRRSAEISGYATDYYGQKTDGLLVPEDKVHVLWGTDLIARSCVTDMIARCEILGAVEHADGTPCEPIGFEIPETDYGYEALRDNLSRDSRWVDTQSVSDSPAFYYAKVKDIQWLVGYSDQSFRSNLAICAVSEDVMAEKGLALGDVIEVVYDLYGIATARVKIVASYATAAPKPILFSPIGYDPRFDTAFSEVDESAPETVGESTEEPEDETTVSMTKEEFMETVGMDFSELVSSGVIQLDTRTYDSFRFVLGDNADLDALRQALADSGFTYVNSGERSKPFAIIEDEMYLNTTQSMERQIQYVGVLYDALYIIAGVIGLVLAWLLTLSRRKEIAVMRAMGTQAYRILLNFAFEQAALSALGILLGGAIAVLTGCSLTPLMLILCGAFWGIWNLSTLVCLIVGLLKPSYASLTEPE